MAVSRVCEFKFAFGSLALNCAVFGVRSHFEHRGGCLLDRGDCDAWVDRPLAMIFISLNVLCRVFGVRSHFEHRGGYLLDRDDCGA